MISLQEQLQSLKNKQNHYDKEHKTFNEQLELLKSRGLIISNDKYALTKLQHINYYRLSAYFLPFQYPKKSKYKNQFLHHTTFEDIIKLYYFDTELRKIIFEAIESIEIYFRTTIAYYHAKEYGSYGYLEQDSFRASEEFFYKISGYLQEEKNRSEEAFIEHFKKEYNTTDLPIWTVVEVISFGTLSKMYTILKTKEQKVVIEKLANINNDVFKNWLHALSVVRNICAHHSRLWNKTLGVSFEVPKKIISFKAIKNPICSLKTKEELDNPLNNKVFFALSVIEYLLSCIGEDEVGFKEKIKQLLHKYPQTDKKAMGFVDDWEKLEMWR